MTISFQCSASTSVTSCIPGNGDLLITRLDGSTVRVDPHARRLLSEIRAAFSRHLVISEAQATALAAWTMHTHVYRQFQHTPRLAITSPEKGCGKTTVIDLLGTLCHSPLKMDNATESVIFRVIDAAAKGQSAGLTLLIDEADSFMAGREGIRNLLNCGFEASGMVWRSVRTGQDFAPRGFGAFAPVAIAGIGELPDTVTSRSIPIRLRRKMNGERIEKVKRYRPALSELGAAVAEWAKTVDFGSLPQPEIPAHFSDREGDISTSLLAIADLAGGEWPCRIRDALQELFASNETESPSGMLLADLRRIFSETGESKVASQLLCDRLGKLEDRLWPEFNNSKVITPAQLARLLKPFGISPRDIRLGAQAGIKGYVLADFMDAWSRYLPPEAPEEPESGVAH